jgi:hypothetical protein
VGSSREDHRPMSQSARRKSTKHRALAASREKALKAGRLEHWYAERAADKLAAERRGEKLAAEAAPPDFTVRTIEATEWVEGERYPRFLLSTNSGGSRPTPPRNP